MKKIMFSDRYGLTEAVLKKIKKQTRRIINPQPTFSELSGINWKGYAYGINSTTKGTYYNFSCTLNYNKSFRGYKVGEVVAVARSYKDDLFIDAVDGGSVRVDGVWYDQHEFEAGWNNKMFVKASLMFHQIKITGIRLERLQDISDEDCLKEGIMTGDFSNTWDKYYYNIIGDCIMHKTFKTPKEAFASLIDKVSGKGTWESNPFVFVYDFELIK